MSAKSIQGQFEDKSFRQGEIALDGSSFVRCRFEGCQMVYAGGAPPMLSGCQFDDCSWNFAGEAANTIAFLSGFYNGGFEDLVEATFHRIRKGDMITQGDAPGGASNQPPKLHGARSASGFPGGSRAGNSY